MIFFEKGLGMFEKFRGTVTRCALMPDSSSSLRHVGRCLGKREQCDDVHDTLSIKVVGIGVA